MGTPDESQTVVLRFRDKQVTTPGRPLVMGIVNVTPDSFSDGGRYDTTESAVRHARRLVEDGADILDIGGESTRPGAQPVSPAEEQARVIPVVEALAEAFPGVPLSVDTRHAETARVGLEAGAHIINDVSALSDPNMAGAVSDAKAGLVLMHMQGRPETMQLDPDYDDVMEDVVRFLDARSGRAVEAGVSADAILVDPGIGFGKRTGQGIEDNCTLLSRLPELVARGRPVLVGASRKRFIGSLTGAPVDDRLPGSLAAALAATWAGAAVLRVHDVAATLQAVRVAASLDPSSWTARWRGR